MMNNTPKKSIYDGIKMSVKTLDVIIAAELVCLALVSVFALICR